MIHEAGEINNDIFNEAIINQYTESAFKISDLRHKLEIYKSNRVLQKERDMMELQAKMQMKEKMRQSLLEKQRDNAKDLSEIVMSDFQSKMLKEIAESSRLPSREFGRDLFSRDGQMPKEDNALFNSSKALLARKFFKEMLSSSEGKAKLYKDILAKGYVNFFVNGFSLTEFN